MQRRCTITTATLAGVSANITQPSIHPVYAKCANDGYLLFQASAHGQRPKPPPGGRLNHSPALSAPVSQRSLACLASLASLASPASPAYATPLAYHRGVRALGCSRDRAAPHPL